MKAVAWVIVYFVMACYTGYAIGYLWHKKHPGRSLEFLWNDLGPLPVVGMMCWPLVLPTVLLVATVRWGFEHWERVCQREQEQQLAHEAAERLLKEEGVL